MGAGDDGVAGAQRAFLDEDGGHRPAALLQLGLDDGPQRRAGGVGGELQDFGLEENVFQEQVHPGLGAGRDGHHDGVPAPLLRDELQRRQVLLHALGVGARKVHLVDGHDQRHLGRLGVGHRLLRLGHDAVVGGHHQHHQVGDVGAPGAHGGEGLVARGVEEGDVAFGRGDGVGANVLGDAARLALGHVGRADGVQERRLPVVDVSHDRDHRWPGALVLGTFRHLRQVVLDFEAHLLHLPAVVGGDDGRGLHVHHLVGGGHGAAGHQLLNNFRRLDAHGLGQVRDADGLLNADDLLLASHLGNLRLLPLLGGLPLLATNRDGDAAPNQVVHLLLGDAAFLVRRALLAAVLLLLLRDVDELAAAAEPIGHHLEFAHLADGLLAGRHGDVFVRGGRGRHPAHGDERPADDHRLGGGGTPLALRAGGCGARTGRAAGAGAGQPRTVGDGLGGGPAAALRRGRPGAGALGRGAGENLGRTEASRRWALRRGCGGGRGLGDGGRRGFAVHGRRGCRRRHGGGLRRRGGHLGDGLGHGLVRHLGQRGRRLHGRDGHRGLGDGGLGRRGCPVGAGVDVGTRAAAADDEALGGHRSRRCLGAALFDNALHRRSGLVVLERAGVTLDVVAERGELGDDLTVVQLDAEGLELPGDFVNALLRHKPLSAVF